jgi:uncharacterized membrane protein
MNIFVTGLLFLLIDSIYLTSTTSHFQTLVKNIQGAQLKLDMLATGLTYISLVLGLWYFILREKRPVFDAFLFGLAVYSVYEFTNKAIFRDWGWDTVMLDTVWGGILFSLTTYLVYKIYGIK